MRLYFMIWITGSSSIKVRDEATGNVYAVGAHDISCSFSLSKVNFIAIFLFIAAVCKLIEWMSYTQAAAAAAASQVMLLLYHTKNGGPFVLYSWTNDRGFASIWMVKILLFTSFLLLRPLLKCFASSSNRDIAEIQFTDILRLDKE